MSERPQAPRKRRRSDFQNRLLAAVKDSLYSTEFEQDELLALEAMIGGGLESEVGMLRIMMRRTLALSRGTSDLEEMRFNLSALGLAAMRVASLLKLRKEMLAEREEVMQQISQAIAQVVEEMRISL
ncbi:MAG: hypothetical protein PHD58_02765 [Anaerolineales bacterium]|nr:hypothetical protein [Anaerolineales bacterium]